MSDTNYGRRSRNQLKEEQKSIERNIKEREIKKYHLYSIRRKGEK
jgi:hypothetical protein